MNLLNTYFPAGVIGSKEDYEWTFDSDAGLDFNGGMIRPSNWGTLICHYINVCMYKSAALFNFYVPTNSKIQKAINLLKIGSEYQIPDRYQILNTTF